MNKTAPLSVLVNSLSKAEKRYFRLYTHLQSGEKAYLVLFDLLDKNTPIQEIPVLFQQQTKGKSFEMAAKYLYHTLLECLLRLREKQDIQTEICNSLSKADILFERDLFEEAFNELESARKKAVLYENDLLLLLILRTELKYRSALQFEDISERQLVSKQMKINEVMKHSRSINLHLQLYNILKYRSIYKGHARSDKQKEAQNDLVLSELHLIANTSYQGFEAQKLHLLFQATYYFSNGNYKSAIRHYQELIALFEENKHLILNPPIYFFTALQGILDSLHVAGLYLEMPFFLNKLKEIPSENYSNEFNLTVKGYIYLYELIVCINTGRFNIAAPLVIEYENTLLKKISFLGLEEQLKLHLILAIYYLCTADLGKSRKYMKKIFGSGKVFYGLPSYKVARLVNLLIQAESGHYDFFENEIPAIKRNLPFEKQVYTTEKLLFKFVQSYPLPVYEKGRTKLWHFYQKEIRKIRKDKYEKQILKIFDFLAWIESKLTRHSFAEILQNQADKNT